MRLRRCGKCGALTFTWVDKEAKAPGWQLGGETCDCPARQRLGIVETDDGLLVVMREKDG